MERADPLIAGAFENTHLHHWVKRLVRLRWAAVGATSAAILLASATHLLERPRPLWVIVAWMSAYNSWFWYWQYARRARLASETSVTTFHRLVLVQLLLDVITLSLLLHYSDSIENPAVMFFAFPVATAAMLLPARMWPVLTTVAALAHGGSVVLEYLGLLSHHPLAGGHLAQSADPLFRSGLLVVGYATVFVIMLNGVAYLVYVVAREHRRAEALRHRHEQLAISRARFARVGQIAAGVAHSVRNPLHGLINSVDLLLARGQPDPKAQPTLSLMAEGLRRIESVTRRLLVLTREAPLLRRLTDVDDLVRDTLHLISPEGSSSKVHIETKLGGVGRADLDPDQLSEALVNVVDNAMAACADGGKVVVSTWCRARQDGDIHIEVSDTGVGIRPEQIGLIFDPFFTTKAVGEGTGLGLAIARRVIEEHGGEISVESQPHEGARLHLVFPRRS